MTIQVPAFEVMSRDTLVTEIAQHLMAFLLSGQVAPGTRLPSERKLAETFGIGRSALREAMKSLNLLGIVEVRQGDGTYLKRTESDLLPQAIEWGLLLGQPRTLDLVEARRHIEVLVARLAAERANEVTVRELRQILRQMKDDRSDVFVEQDVAFHMKLAEIAGNSVLADVLSSIRTLLRVWMRRVVEAAGETGTSYREHAKVFEAVRRGDPEAAGAAMAAHMESASGQLLASLQSSRGPAPGRETAERKSRQAVDRRAGAGNGKAGRR